MIFLIIGQTKLKKSGTKLIKFKELKNLDNIKNLNKSVSIFRIMVNVIILNYGEDN